MHYKYHRDYSYLKLHIHLGNSKLKFSMLVNCSAFKGLIKKIKNIKKNLYICCIK
jgi:hypothetical protein